MLIRTVKIKLIPTTSQKQILQETFNTCNKALNWISDKAWENKCFNRVALHHLIYYQLRESFNLPSQMAIALKDKVCVSYKGDGSKKHKFKAKVLPLNFPRTASFKSKDKDKNKNKDIISILTLKGRIKIEMVIGEFQNQYLKDKSWEIRESELVYYNRGYFLHLRVEREEPEEIIPKAVLGVDRGINNIATISSGERFCGKKVKDVRERYQRLRSSLQAKGTRSAKRKLKRLSGREKRFQKHINHVVSKYIVSLAVKYGWAIALEDLKGIKKSKSSRQGNKGSKKFNQALGRWATYQLQQFIEYKARAKGIAVIFVKPKHSSSECSNCHHICKQNRRGESFCCRACGFFTHADRNAASIISLRATVNLPNVADNRLMSKQQQCQHHQLVS